MKKIAINGFGRIGRLAFRNLLEHKNISVVAINDLADAKTLAHLLKYDTAHGILENDITFTDDTIVVDGHSIQVFAKRNPAELPWERLEIDLVLECTGVFRNAEGMQKHLSAGAKKVLLSAPPADKTIPSIVQGVNDHLLDSNPILLSCSSCTTNCLAPVIKVIHEAFGISKGFITTTHAYTADQRLQDAPHKDLRRARAAAANMVPTTTGAAKAIDNVYPAVANRLEAMAIRVPVITGSLIDVNLILEKETDADTLNAHFIKAASGELKGILSYVELPLVSSDIIGNHHSAIVDGLLTSVRGNFAKVIAWYDNETGYATRLADLAAKVA
jgi:glyceraldehyde 3-phosphate dehydrogenase